jgi:glycosyltransferase involved in cell wall biosynthesis
MAGEPRGRAMAHPVPFVSVAVPVLNAERTIGDCLASLLRTDYPAERREIVVVDNGSTDGTARIVGGFPVRCVREERRGIPYARNRGIEESRGELVAMTDADCVASTWWLQELVRGFEDDSVGGVEGETVAYPPRTPVERYTARRSLSYRARLFSPAAPFVITANVAFRRDVFDRIGLFDTRFVGGSDVDLSWRFFERSGLKLRYNPKAIVFHRHRATVCGFLAQHIRIGRGFATLRRKYPERLPWTWDQEARAWLAVAGLGMAATRAAIRYRVHGGDERQLYDPFLTFFRKLGVRLGFVAESLTWTRRT